MKIPYHEGVQKATFNAVMVMVIVASLGGIAFFGSRQTSVQLTTDTVQRTTSDKQSIMHTPPLAPPHGGGGSASTSSVAGRQLSVNVLPFLRAALTNPAGYESLQEQNILIAGIPGKGNPAPNLTDTILIAHIEPDPAEAVLFSLPRDLLVQASDATYYTKLNGLYDRGGVTALRLKAEEVTGLEITRYAIIDLTALREIVDALGGVNVYVEKDINDPRFPSGNLGYETFALEAGWRYMDGWTASRYARTRNDREGDFGRMRRQQLLLEAIKQKITGLSFVWDIGTFLKIFDSVETHVQTNIANPELLQFFEWGKALANDRITLAPLDADAEKQLFTTGDFWFGVERASVVKPLEGLERYASIREYVDEVMGKKK